MIAFAKRFVSPQSDYWNPPTPRTAGDSNVESIYSAVGYALSMWEQLESELAELFTTLIGSQTSAAARAYGVIASAGGRCDALKAAGEVFFSNRNEEAGDVDAFKQLLNNYGRAAARRNEIAHGYAACGNVGSVGLGAFLIAPEYNTRKTAIGDIRFYLNDGPSGTRSRYAYVGEEIRTFGTRFKYLAEDASRHHAYIKTK